MSAAEWARRKAAGICCTKGCEEKAVSGVLCMPHRKRQRARGSKSVKKRYWEHKLAGICVRSGCDATPVEDSNMCAKHREVQRGEQRAFYLKGPKRRIQMAASARSRRKRRVSKHLCVACPARAVTKTMCEKHRRYHRALAAKYRIKLRVRAWPALDIDHYAAARNPEGAT